VKKDLFNFDLSNSSDAGGSLGAKQQLLLR
jgi:hypothetical protein